MVFPKKSVQRSNKLFEFASDEAIFLNLLTQYGMNRFNFLILNYLNIQDYVYKTKKTAQSEDRAAFKKKA